MFIMVKKIFSIFATIVILAACVKMPDSEKSLITDYDENKLNSEFTASSSKTTFAFTAKKTWTASFKYINDSEDSNWLTIDKMEGEEGRIIIGISLDVNYTGKNRESIIVIQCEDSVVKLNIIQKATDENGEIPEIPPLSDIEKISKDVYYLYTIKGRDYFDEMFKINNTLKSVIYYNKATIKKNDLPIKESIIGIYSDKCKVIDALSFSDCNNLILIDLPACVIIENNAFSGCSNLESVNLPICTEIGDNAFFDCPNLGSVKLPMCEKIGMNVFFNCANIVSMHLDKCESIGDNVFSNCNKIKDILFLSKKNILSTKLTFEGLNTKNIIITLNPDGVERESVVNNTWKDKEWAKLQDNK